MALLMKRWIPNLARIGVRAMASSTTANSSDPSFVDGLRYRAARASDHAGVMAINTDVYSGRDYLGSTFLPLLDNENALSVVVETEIGEIVAYSEAEVIDDGRSVIFRAGRVREDFRGRGLTKTMFQPFHDFIASKGPYEHAYGLTNWFVEKPGDEQGERKDIFPCKYRQTPDLSQKVDRLLSTCNDEPPEVLTKKSLLSIMELYGDQKNSEYNWPNKMVVNWNPIDLENSNIDLFLSVNSFACASVVDSNSDDSSTNKDEPSKRPMVLSFGNYFPCKIGIGYNLDVYWLGSHGDPLCSKNVHLAEQHVMRHIQHGADIAEGREVWLNVFMDTRWVGCTETVSGLKEKLGLGEPAWNWKDQFIRRIKPF